MRAKQEINQHSLCMGRQLLTLMVAYVLNLFRQMADAVQAAHGIERIDQASDEADDLILPTSVVDPRGEDVLWIVVCRSTCGHGNHYHEIPDLKVEH